ncbi:MAG: flippase [Blastomonas sp.]|jgi:O-antigen/teichoic acid export membrane protein|uniref:flippase n=1 Tax=Blastomonas TaxID=150203 RepID=UPI002585EA93|nr:MULTISPECIES: flippase [Blastomonas]MCO5791484.1 flippase [Blastomonas sp.]MDM7966162.1 flippase [Blastomonas fulva]
MSVSRNSAYNLVGAALPIVLALATVPVYLKLVGPDRYGVLAIAWLLLGYFGLFDLGLGRATSQRIAALRDAPPAERAATFWTALCVNVVMGAVGALLFWPLSYYLFGHFFRVDEALRPEVIAAAPLLALAVPVATTTGVLTGALQGRERFLEVNIISVLSTTLFQLLPLAVAWLYGPYLPVVLLSALGARALALLVLWQRCQVDLVRGQPVRPDRKLVKPLLSYGGWVMLTSMIGPLLVVSDRFLIGAILGAVVVGHYAVVFQLAERITVVPMSLTNAMFPRLATLTGEDANRLTASAITAVLAIMTPVMVAGVFILDPFLSIWVGADIAREVGFVGKILLAGYWINSLSLVPYARLQATGRPDLVTKVLLVELPVYLPVLYFALTSFGLVGAAVTFSLRLAVDYVLLSLVAGRIAAPWATLGCAVLLLAGLAISEIASLSLMALLGIGALLTAVAMALGLWIAPPQLRQIITRVLPWGRQSIARVR